MASWMIHSGEWTLRWKEDTQGYSDPGPAGPHSIPWSSLAAEGGQSLINLHRFQAARKILEDLLKIDPKHFDGRCQLALIFGRLGETSQARAMIEKAAKERPGDPEAQGILGRVYKDMWRVRWEKIASLQERQQIAVQHCNLAGEAIRSYEVATKNKLNSYYNGINVVSLLRLIEHLNGVSQNHQPIVYWGNIGIGFLLSEWQPKKPWIDQFPKTIMMKRFGHGRPWGNYP